MIVVSTSLIPFLEMNNSANEVIDFTHEKGSQITIVVQTTEKDKTTQYFEVLKQGGQVNEPLQASFFSPAYGNGTDKFGVTFRILTRGHQ